MKGNIVGTIDVAQVVLYLFWVFFAGLIFYLRREDRREGYPLEADPTGRVGDVFSLVAPIPAPKTFRLPDGRTTQAPNFKRDTRPLRAEKVEPFPGAPYAPTGDPMLAAVGPGSFAERADVADITTEGHPRIAPLRAATPTGSAGHSGGFGIAPGDRDPRGMSVLGTDGEVAGVVSDVWVDRSEALMRYLEVELPGGTRRVLLPVPFARIDQARRQVRVDALYANQFAGVPGLKNPDSVTLLEEDKVAAYYGGGTLYADANRTESFL